MLKMNAYKCRQIISIDPHMAGTPADKEAVNENKTSHINHTDTIGYTSTINYIITILNSSPLHQFLIVSCNENHLIKIGV
jgi:hypothetical protein